MGESKERKSDGRGKVSWYSVADVEPTKSSGGHRTESHRRRVLLTREAILATVLLSRIRLSTELLGNASPDTRSKNCVVREYVTLPYQLMLNLIRPWVW
jgi:hypothetical protein